MMQADPTSWQRRVAVFLSLFMATCLTTTWAGAVALHPQLNWSNVFSKWPWLFDGLPFSAALMAILLSHEMGHFVVARYHGVPTTLPFFIPLPVGLIGTFGAVINMPRPVRDRNALVDIGAAGPLAGLVVALPVLVYGLYCSPVAAPAPMSLQEGNSLLYAALKYAVKGMVLPAHGLDVQLHPLAWAGWVGLLITMINLLPVGQLDGGHIAHGYFGQAYERMVPWLHRGLLFWGLAATAFAAYELKGRVVGYSCWLMGVAAGMPWFLWWGMLHVMRLLSRGLYHPPVDDRPLTRGRRYLCGLMLVVLMAIAMPLPLRRLM